MLCLCAELPRILHTSLRTPMVTECIAATCSQLSLPNAHDHHPVGRDIRSSLDPPPCPKEGSEIRGGCPASLCCPPLSLLRFIGVFLCCPDAEQWQRGCSIAEHDPTQPMQFYSQSAAFRQILAVRGNEGIWLPKKAVLWGSTGSSHPELLTCSSTAGSSRAPSEMDISIGPHLL